LGHRATVGIVPRLRHGLLVIPTTHREVLAGLELHDRCNADLVPEDDVALVGNPREAETVSLEIPAAEVVHNVRLKACAIAPVLRVLLGGQMMPPIKAMRIQVTAPEMVRATMSLSSALI